MRVVIKVAKKDQAKACGHSCGIPRNCLVGQNLHRLPAAIQALRNLG